jgi:uncharacterized protein YkwD
MRLPFVTALSIFALVGWALVLQERGEFLPPGLLTEEAPEVAVLPPVPTVQEETETTEPLAEIEEEAAAPQEPGPLAADPEPPLVGAAAQVSIVVYDEEYVEDLERAIHDAINVERARAGVGILAYDEALAEIAAGHSTDMAKENYFAHEDEDGCTSSCRVTAAGYRWRWVGENLFLLRSSHRYTVEEGAAIIVAGWMGSEGHRKNVLSKNFTHQGLGVVVNGNALYATEVFARPR